MSESLAKDLANVLEVTFNHASVHINVLLIINFLFLTLFSLTGGDLLLAGHTHRDTRVNCRTHQG